VYDPERKYLLASSLLNRGEQNRGGFRKIMKTGFTGICPLSSRPFPPVSRALRDLREGLSFSGKSLRRTIYLNPPPCGASFAAKRQVGFHCRPIAGLSTAMKKIVTLLL